MRSANGATQIALRSVTAPRPACRGASGQAFLHCLHFARRHPALDSHVLRRPHGENDAHVGIEDREVLP